MKISLYSITYLGVWYDGPALKFDELVQRAKDYGYDGVELDGKRPHGNPLDLDQRTREKMRNALAEAGLELPCVAANNDFSSPIPEHRECQLLMVHELARLAADLGAKVVRLFAAWPGIVMHNGIAVYDLVKSPFYTFEGQYPFATRLERWNFVRDCLREAAAFGEEFGVVMALQNHAPLIRHWKDTLDLVNEVNSPWLKVCLDLPLLTSYDPAFVRKAVQAVGKAQVYTHFGGEFVRDEQGKVQPKPWDWGMPVPDYANFAQQLREIGYDGYFGYELCHPVLDEAHNPLGLDYVDQQAQMAREFMSDCLAK